MVYTLHLCAKGLSKLQKAILGLLDGSVKHGVYSSENNTHYWEIAERTDSTR